MFDHLRGMMVVIGELVSNLPYSRFRMYRVGFMALGIGATLVVLAGLRVRLPRTPAGVYLGSFLALLFIWPYEAALAYTSRITLSGDDFSQAYGRAGGLSAPDSTGRVDTLHNAHARALMKRYARPF